MIKRLSHQVESNLSHHKSPGNFQAYIDTLLLKAALVSESVSMSRKDVRVMQWVAWVCVLLLAVTQREASTRLRTFQSFSPDLEDAVSFPSRKLSLAEEVTFLEPTTAAAALSTNHTSLKPRGARFLMGIFSVQEDYVKRKLIRRALRMYNDTRICAMGSTTATMPPPPPEGCELIYTFVIGAKLRGATQIVGGSPRSLITNPFLLRGKGPKPKKKKQKKQTKQQQHPVLKKREPKDVTFLNIRVRQK